ncbi:FAD-dependent oxidoreductase [Streptomyces somaliensis DSM 40738]|uniref:FAD-dependent oxidoreductase n=1 Tax=Streptomyces somaliensis (strain ATCC 33201 / DSM 40738 / JCM 12659 / KCTC 9044 / NCTC 11332 / NRRL B-12077 / IP 733) TaxID=1134445 RepID=A0AA44DE51_STRE0|nr:NAD(P)/FAD-dependent oxidoreductase [Streptomyces somaliensis]MCQ0022464.1 FAD-dependent oxidoreductase [Streptomyces somaliensis DSM 40738]NKY14592.1 FAD-dependent oxidoreductase [Streptomyces somaliensis DSM 40738]
MLSTADHADVVVVGAGLAGLAAAHRLAGAGLAVRVLEAASEVGGRMATDHVDGFRLDRAGQLLNTSCPELHRYACVDTGALRPFQPGALVHSAGRLYRAGEVRGGPRSALTRARALAGGPRPLDQARLGASLARLADTPVERLLARRERPASEALAGRGPSSRAAAAFLRPLLGALLSDPDLTTSSRCADLALRGFARGRLCVPAGGASRLPERMAAALPTGTVRTGVRVEEASINRVATAEHGEFTCRSLVVATGARAAAELLPGLRVPGFHPVTVLHHTAPAAPLAAPALVLDADRAGPVSHTAVMSEVDPSRAPRGRALVTSTVLGTPPDDLDARVRRHLAALYGTGTADWELLAVRHDPEAVPAMPAPHDLRRPVRLLAGLYVCGDHRDVSSPQGALHSGHRAARAVLRDLGLPSAEPSARAEAA